MHTSHKTPCHKSSTNPEDKYKHNFHLNQYLLPEKAIIIFKASAKRSLWLICGAIAIVWMGVVIYRGLRGQADEGEKITEDVTNLLTKSEDEIAELVLTECVSGTEEDMCLAGVFDEEMDEMADAWYNEIKLILMVQQSWDFLSLTPNYTMSDNWVIEYYSWSVATTLSVSNGYVKWSTDMEWLTTVFIGLAVAVFSSAVLSTAFTCSAFLTLCINYAGIRKDSDKHIQNCKWLADRYVKEHCNLGYTNEAFQQAAAKLAMRNVPTMAEVMLEAMALRGGSRASVAGRGREERGKESRSESGFGPGLGGEGGRGRGMGLRAVMTLSNITLHERQLEERSSKLKLANCKNQNYNSPSPELETAGHNSPGSAAADTGCCLLSDGVSEAGNVSEDVFEPREGDAVCGTSDGLGHPRHDNVQAFPPEEIDTTGEERKTFLQSAHFFKSCATPNYKIHPHPPMQSRATGDSKGAEYPTLDDPPHIHTNTPPSSENNTKRRTPMKSQRLLLRSQQRRRENKPTRQYYETLIGSGRFSEDQRNVKDNAYMGLASTVCNAGTHEDDHAEKCHPAYAAPRGLTDEICRRETSWDTRTCQAKHNYPSLDRIVDTIDSMEPDQYPPSLRTHDHMSNERHRHVWLEHPIVDPTGKLESGLRNEPEHCPYTRDSHNQKCCLDPEAGCLCQLCRESDTSYKNEPYEGLISNKRNRSKHFIGANYEYTHDHIDDTCWLTDGVTDFEDPDLFPKGNHSDNPSKLELCHSADEVLDPYAASSIYSSETRHYGITREKADAFSKSRGLRRRRHKANSKGNAEVVHRTHSCPDVTAKSQTPEYHAGVSSSQNISSNASFPSRCDPFRLNSRNCSRTNCEEPTHREPNGCMGRLHCLWPSRLQSLVTMGRSQVGPNSECYSHCSVCHNEKAEERFATETLHLYDFNLLESCISLLLLILYLIVGGVVLHNICDSGGESLNIVHSLVFMAATVELPAICNNRESLQSCKDVFIYMYTSILLILVAMTLQVFRPVGEVKLERPRLREDLTTELQYNMEHMYRRKYGRAKVTAGHNTS